MDIIILGFPKCGTSALVRELDRLPDVDLLRAPKTPAMPKGHIEYTWPMFRSVPAPADPTRIRVHKYTGYAFDRAALQFLAQTHPDALYVVCIRSAARALISWHDMHRRIATGGHRKDHFAWKERAFYATCSLADYYRRYAHDRLQYDLHLQTILTALSPAKPAIVAQERMSHDLPAIAEELVRTLTGEYRIGAMLEPEYHGHVSFAEAAHPQIDAEIAADLDAVDAGLHRLIDSANLLTFL